MQQLKFYGKLFLRAPLWFRILAPATLLLSILLNDSLGKLAAAAFFCIAGIQLRYNRRLSFVFYALAVLSLYMAWDRME